MACRGLRGARGRCGEKHGGGGPDGLRKRGRLRRWEAERLAAGDSLERRARGPLDSAASGRWTGGVRWASRPLVEMVPRGAANRGASARTRAAVEGFYPGPVDGRSRDGTHGRRSGGMARSRGTDPAKRRLRASSHPREPSLGGSGHRGGRTLHRTSGRDTGFHGMHRLRGDGAGQWRGDCGRTIVGGRHVVDQSAVRPTAPPPA